MSSRVTLSRRSLVRGLSLLLAAAPALAACGNGGIRPLYGATPSGAGLQERMAQVDVATIPGRVGGSGWPPPVLRNIRSLRMRWPTHRLEVTIRESVISTLVRIDGESLGQIYAVEASFQLISIKDKKVVLKGSSHARAGFERFQAIYSNVRARDDAENRAARTIADDIKTRVATYLATEA